ncbi:hypothetical protein MGYG_02861 [Nannizzia gypsea CBS 118893]|uniref:Uncharacterized protein n=1 Tax=Arthroderma gypseum (strain ATCC MYA-4604 / CBS 118893) TaxID=535722 RepID=E4UPH4_ARTGP|nr:hypothetical protein MGYG_02861 [Nannizzia gypsea CBS 118893]EFQ99849.1 hypothetical protein MGYG_02861 [Nannizzia gypsea CBS 118893]
MAGSTIIIFFVSSTHCHPLLIRSRRGNNLALMCEVMQDYGVRGEKSQLDDENASGVFSVNPNLAASGSISKFGHRTPQADISTTMLSCIQKKKTPFPSLSAHTFDSWWSASPSVGSLHQPTRCMLESNFRSFSFLGTPEVFRPLLFADKRKRHLQLPHGYSSVEIRNANTARLQNSPYCIVSEAVLSNQVFSVLHRL